MSSGLNLRTKAMGLGPCTVSEVVWPPRKRTCTAIGSFFVSVTSSINNASIRLRSRDSVRGSFHTRGKLRASERILARRIIEQALIRLALAIVFLLQRLEPAQLIVPVRFERIGDEAVIGIAF